MSFCSKCGAELSDDTRFCQMCGQSVGGENNPYATNMTLDSVSYASGTGFTELNEPMSFGEAVSTCFSKYADFSGRARRAEFWYFYLFNFLVNLPLNIISKIFQDGLGITIIIALAQLALVLPFMAVTARRLHDRGTSGWFQLAPFGSMLLGLGLLALGAAFNRSSDLSPLVYAGLFCFVLAIPLGIILLIRLVRIGDAGDNQYGPDPLGRQI